MLRQALPFTKQAVRRSIGSVSQAQWPATRLEPYSFQVQLLYLHMLGVGTDS